MQGSLLFMQAAAVGWSHAAVLRHIVSSALQRALLAPLSPPVEPVARDPETLSQGEDLPGSVMAHFTNTLDEMQEVHGEDWPATWEAEEGGTACGNAWRQPGSLLRELTDSDSQEASAHSPSPPEKRGKVQCLREMATYGKATSLEEIEDEAFADLLEEWQEGEAGLRDEDALQPLQPGDSLIERATLQGVSARELEERDMERLVEEIYQESQEDEVANASPSGQGLGLHDIPESLHAESVGAGSKMLGSSMAYGGPGMMGDLVEEDGSSNQQMQPRIGPSGAPGQRQKVYVLCGGDSSERNVSLQSGVTV